MNTTPKISVIVPVYNTEKYLRRCIDSILSQTFTDFELLLIDEGSKDSSGAICDDYAAKDKRVRVFHKENGGVSSARNLGLDNANGEWITFVDSDDWVYPCWLENYNILEYGVKYDMICQGFYATKSLSLDDATQTDFGINFEGCIDEMLELMFKKYILGYVWCKAFRFDIIKKSFIRFYDTIKLCEDEVFILQYAQYCNKCMSVDQAGYVYTPPNWEQKYFMNYTDWEKLRTTQITFLIKCCIDKRTSLFRYYFEDLTSKCIEEFRHSKSNKHSCLTCLRELLKIDYKHSQLFPITKFFIYIDSTTYISRYVLSMHLKLKGM